jgi:hypothetical protein
MDRLLILESVHLSFSVVQRLRSEMYLCGESSSRHIPSDCNHSVFYEIEDLFHKKLIP